MGGRSSIALLLMGGVAAGIGIAAMAGSPEPVVRIAARQFSFEPHEITLTRGVPVILELISIDRAHGFRAPELGLRADVLPGQTARIRIVPERVGSFTFLCDVFCGTDHDDMDGTIRVVER